jgi:hypothetical protein
LEYHKTMRRWLVIFMLFLLPLRGLVGDAMAYSMLPAGMPASGEVAQNATKYVATYVHSTGTSSMFEHENAAQTTSQPPCHMDMAVSEDAGTPQSQCTTCQACHLSVAIPMQLPDGILHTTAVAPVQRTAFWIGADLRLLAKTPVL